MREYRDWRQGLVTVKSHLCHDLRMTYLTWQLTFPHI